jgi:hypothetical protein
MTEPSPGRPTLGRRATLREAPEGRAFGANRLRVRMEGCWRERE